MTYMRIVKRFLVVRVTVISKKRGTFEMTLFCPMCRAKLNLDDYIPKAKIEARIKAIEEYPLESKTDIEILKELKELLK